MIGVVCWIWKKVGWWVVDYFNLYQHKRNQEPLPR